MLAFAWMDREKKYDISPGWKMSEGLPNIRSKLRQKNEELNAKPEQLTLVIDQPKACELYYACCVMVIDIVVVDRLIYKLKESGNKRLVKKNQYFFVVYLYCRCIVRVF